MVEARGAANPHQTKENSGHIAMKTGWNSDAGANGMAAAHDVTRSRKELDPPTTAAYTSDGVYSPDALEEMNEPITQYYRCPNGYVQLALKGPLSESRGYFRFGRGAVCYGQYSGRRPSASPVDALFDASPDVSIEGGTTYLPFDLRQVVDSLRNELYVDSWRNRNPVSAIAKMYYSIRPLLPVAVRKHLQRIHLKGWNKLRFPHWPVDRSVDNLFRQLLLISLRSRGLGRIPFIWFWPEGASSCAIMTHDVETAMGRDFCSSLMDIDDSFGIKASFQVIPEGRYEVTPEFVESIQKRGFEVAIHDFNHDGHLYRNRQEFLERAAKINASGKKYGAAGFRAAVLYRKQLWYDALKFSYDMSVPNTAHLDPQRGGCCTVMPYFIGDILELPVTATQDYSLFHILQDYSINLWRRQIDLIMERHGLISFIVHPDYITGLRERSTYKALLAHLAQLREEGNIWIATPGEVSCWWRQRAEMELIEDGESLRIEGTGKERARIAYASEQDGQLVFSLQTETGDQTDLVSAQ
jgi:hypothetical protein